MSYEDLSYFIQHVGKDPARLIFEDELTGLYNRRFLLNYFQYKVTWDAPDLNPLSLIMVDLDDFKQINDRFGHDSGDQVLIWFASVLRELTGDYGIAVRYAGDEFIILMPRGDKQAAMQVGERLLRLVGEEPCRLQEEDECLNLTVSIGIASAPEDAQSSKELIRKADAALYFAKKSGGNRLAEAGKTLPQAVFAKTALHHLDSARISGRGPQLAVVGKAFRKFSQRISQFLIFEGGAGMGKSEFLQAVHRTLAQSKIEQIRVHGIAQELFRPYYLVTNILVELLNQREDVRVGVLENLSPKEIVYLSQILPQLGGKEKVTLEQDERALREGVFTALVHFFTKALDNSPLILLIDDFHFSDAATLILLRQLMLSQEIPLLIFATSVEIRQLVEQKQKVPLEGFYAAHAEELGMRKISLTSLSANDISEHLQTIFPQVSLPDNFAGDLARVSQGNPFFLTEILRKLVLDQKVSLVGQQWVIEPLEEGYLPQSLEEIVSDKIAVLDAESRQLLDQASVLGEDFSLSFLTGCSQGMEAKVLEFVDKAVAQGLIHTDFQINDETIRFLCKRVMEITYGAIEDDRKQELHERIGNYQETLFQHGLLASAAPLAYHFQRSANEDKLRKYMELQAATDEKLFNLFEGLEYTGEQQSGDSPADVPLNPRSLMHIPRMIRLLLTTVHHIKLYPPGSDTIVDSTNQFRETIDKILADNERVHISLANHQLMVNGEAVDVTDFEPIIEAFFKFLGEMDLKAIAFSRGLNEHELKVMLEGLGRVSRKMIDKRFWQRFSAEQGLIHIELRQLRYTEVEKPDDRIADRKTSGKYGSTSPTDAAYRQLGGKQMFDEDELTKIPHVIRCLLTAANNIKLYPPESKAISESIAHLMQALDDFLSKRPALVLARVNSSLLVNGEKVDATDFKMVADGFLKWLESLNLRSITFLKQISVDELRTFISALGKLPTDVLDRNFWRRLASEGKLSHILFDQHLYEILEELAGMSSGTDQQTKERLEEIDQAPEKGEPVSENDLAVQVSPVAEHHSMLPEVKKTKPGNEEEEYTDAYLQEIHGKLNDVLIKGSEEEINKILSQLFQGFENRASEARRKVVYICCDLLKNLSLGLQHRFAKLAADPVLLTLSEEREPDILEKMAELLYETAAILIQFADYIMASRIYLHLHRRHQELEKSNKEHAQRLAAILNRELEFTTWEVLKENLKSSEPSKQQNTVQLLGSMGRVTIPLLIEIIKEDHELRVRQIAISLLKEIASDAAKLLKDELVVVTTPEERLRVLEMLVTVTNDIHTELACAFGDEHSKVRRAAFRLAERLNDDRVVEILLNYAQHEQNGLAVSAIKCLGKLKREAATKAVITILNSVKETERLIACCRALGEIADSASIEPLARLLASGSFLSLRKKRSALVRATAALALARIAHPRVAEVLAPYVNDPDPRIRQVACNMVNTVKDTVTD